MANAVYRDFAPDIAYNKRNNRPDSVGVCRIPTNLYVPRILSSVSTLLRRSPSTLRQPQIEILSLSHHPNRVGVVFRERLEYFFRRLFDVPNEARWRLSPGAKHLARFALVYDLSPRSPPKPTILEQLKLVRLGQQRSRLRRLFYVRCVLDELD